VAGRSKWEIRSPTAILFVLTAINTLNYVDRQVIGPLVQSLCKPVSQGGLGISLTEAGLLQFAFMIVHSLASIPMGMAADRVARKRLISLGVAVWSVATTLAAFARGFGTMFMARGAVGIGEATYAPAASTLISDSFKPARRAEALGVFQAGSVIGGGIAVVLGSAMGAHYGWRMAFAIVGIPGLIFALLALAMREPRRGGGAAAAALHGHSLTMEAVRSGGGELWRSRQVRWIITSGVLLTFFAGALVFWGIAYVLRSYYSPLGRQIAAQVTHAPALLLDWMYPLKEHLQRVGLTFGAVAGPSALVGTLVGSVLADRAEKKDPGAGRLKVIALGVFVGAPLALVGLLGHNLVLLYVCLGVGVFFNSFYLGPILAALHDAVPERLRGTATGVYFLVVHLLGDAISPAVVGAVADLSSSLAIGLGVATVVGIFGGVCALRAMPRRGAQLASSRPT
jgi:MFS family permease